MKKIAFLVIVVLFVFGCSSVTIVTDYDHSKDFTAFKTFAIYKGKTIPGDELAKHPLIKKRIIDAIKAELEKKGFKYVDDESASFVVVLHAGVREKTQITNWGSYGWYDPWWGPYGGGGIDVSQYDEATVVIDLVDSRDKELAWRAKVTKVIDSSSGQDPAALRHLVAEALKDFPPPGK